MPFPSVNKKSSEYLRPSDIRSGLAPGDPGPQLSICSRTLCRLFLLPFKSLKRRRICALLSNATAPMCVALSEISNLLISAFAKVFAKVKLSLLYCPVLSRAKPRSTGLLQVLAAERSKPKENKLNLFSF